MVRRISRSDGLVLKDVRLRALRDAPYAFSEKLLDVEHDPDSEWIERAVEMSSEGSDSVAFLAFDEDTVLAIGMAGGYVHPERGDEAHVWGVWLDPVARGRGVGRELVEAVIAWATRRGHPRLTLCVMETSASAISLYRALGFDEEGCPSPSTYHEGVSEVSMARSLVGS
jgi:ribosomal protein S18 acetylase RimI-like enzyme